MTIDIPSPVIPTGMSIAVALANGLLPANIQVTGQGNGATNPTLKHEIGVGKIDPSALASTLSFASPNAQYGGN